VTLVERFRVLRLVKVPARHAVVVAALTRHVRKFPGAAALVDWDRGLEMAKHKTFTWQDVKVYFCDPQSLGSVARKKHEWALRQYFPKKTDCPATPSRIWTKWHCA